MMHSINCDLAPKDAVEIKSNGNIMRFFNSQGQWWHGWSEDWNHTKNPKDWTVVATLPTEKKKTVPKEKWTHTDNHGEECFIAATYNDCAWIVRRMTEDKIVPLEDLKPIKPRITKAQAWDKVKSLSLYEGYSFGVAHEVIANNYEVIDE